MGRATVTYTLKKEGFSCVLFFFISPMFKKFKALKTYMIKSTYYDFFDLSNIIWEGRKG